MSRFMPVGPRPYGTCTGDDGLEATAARQPDGQVVVAGSPVLVQRGHRWGPENTEVVLNCSPNDVVPKLHGIYSSSFQIVAKMSMDDIDDGKRHLLQLSQQSSFFELSTLAVTNSYNAL